MDNNIYHPEYVKTLFDKMSRSYEGMNYITSFGFSLRWRKQFLEPLNNSKAPLQILDLLTGMGETWSFIQKKWPNSTLTALDFSDEMLKFAQQKNELLFDNKITIVQQDVLNNELPSDYFDIVTCAFGLKTFDEQQLVKLATETKRVLKKGGQFSFVELSKPSSKLLQLLFGFYLGKVIPILGRVFGGNPIGYRMLWKYVVEFEHAQKAAQLFAKEGLKVTFSSYFGGCATGMIGEKL